MNDRSLSVLEQYEINITQVRKGRGGYLIETPDKTYFFMEYSGNVKKLFLISYLQDKMKECIQTDTIVRNKEGELYVKDKDEQQYILKEQPLGRECNHKSEEDLILTFSHMAKLHISLKKAYKSYLVNEAPLPYTLNYKSYITELDKHTKECRHIKKYLISQNNKTSFERTLLQYYDLFLEKAFQISSQMNKLDKEKIYQEIIEQNMLYHGDFQYHNIIFYKNSLASTHYEHIGMGSGMKDFCYLFRKINEKNNWNIQLADKMLNTYLKQYTLSSYEWEQLKNTLNYPIKFWKIVNYYYNNRKSWISERNFEKLSFLVMQENQKEEMLKTLFNNSCTL